MLAGSFIGAALLWSQIDLHRRFDEELIDYLLEIKWWDWSAEKIFRNLEQLCSGDLTKIKMVG